MALMTVALAAGNFDEAMAQLVSAASAGADAVELRIDFMDETGRNRVGELVAAARSRGLASIVTLRHVSEGGRFDGGPARRVDLLMQADRAGADFVDIEWANYQSTPFRPHHSRLILSAHDFERCPAGLGGLARQMAAVPGAIPKLAYLPRSINDCFVALDILHERRGSIAIAMGEAGLMTRLLAPKLGGLLSFFTAGAASATAPGQIDLRRARELYRWPAITPATRLLGVCGFPVAHSLSPALHNSAFRAVNYDGLYLPLPVEPDEASFDLFLQNCLDRPWLAVRGLSVTVPHKQHALTALRRRSGRIDPLAEKIGALNTILFESDGSLAGYNTDYGGAMNGIYQTLGIGPHDLKGLAAAVLGAGGAARAIVAGLTDAGVAVTIFNRTVEKGRELADLFGCRCAPLADLPRFDAQLIVNCTTLGMHPNTETCPVPDDYLKPGMIVFDTVYNPLHTKLLQLASAAGARRVDGVSMFVNQAALQFQLYTGQTPPVVLMDQTVRHLLA